MQIAKGFAGFIGKTNLAQPWAGEHLGQPIIEHRLPNGKLWCFGTNTSVGSIPTADGWCVGPPFSLLSNEVLPPRDLDGVRRVLPSFDGRFGLCLSVPTGEVVIATDYLGLGPVFYGEFKGTVYFATYLGLLLDMLDGLPPLDHLGLTSMLGGTTLIGGRTPHAGVRRLMAGQMAVISFEGVARLSLEKYADPVQILAKNAGGGRDPLEEFDYHLRASVAREELPTEGLALMLSGGKDSTALAYVLAEQGRTAFETVTFGRHFCKDMLGARQTARELGLRHRRIPYAHWSLREEAPFISALSGGSSGIQTSHNIVGYRHVRSYAKTAMVGFMGDAITGAHINVRPEHRLSLRCTELWKAPFNESYREELATLREELTRQRENLKDLAPHQRALLLDFTVRQATYISQTFSLCEWWVPLNTPFCHRGLISFLFQRPAEELEKQRFYDRWLAWKSGVLRQSRSSLSGLLQNLERAVRVRMSRRLGTPHPGPTVNWHRMQRDSFAWLKETISRYDEDDRLRSTMQVELERLRRGPRANTLSPILFGASVILSRQR